MYVLVNTFLAIFLKKHKKRQSNKVSCFRQRKIVKFVGWLELFLYYQDNRNLGGYAPQTPQKREIYTAPRRPHGPPRGGGFALFYPQNWHLAQHPQHKLVSMFNRPDSQKHINCGADYIERNKKIQNACACLNIFKQLIDKRSECSRNNGKIKKSN